MKIEKKGDNTYEASTKSEVTYTWGVMEEYSPNFGTEEAVSKLDLKSVTQTDLDKKCAKVSEHEEISIIVNTKVVYQLTLKNNKITQETLKKEDLDVRCVGNY